MRKKCKTLFMLALCCTLLGSTSIVYATSKGVSADKAKATATSTKVEKPDFLSSFEEVENSADYVGTTKSLLETNETVAKFNTNYTYLILSKDSKGYYYMTELGEEYVKTAKDVKNAEFLTMFGDFGFSSNYFSFDDSFTILVKDGKDIKYVGTYTSVSELSRLDDFLNYSRDAKVSLTTKDKTSTSVTIHVDYELDDAYKLNDPYGAELRKITLYNGEDEVEVHTGKDDNPYDFTVEFNSTYRVVVDTYTGGGEAKIKVTGLKDTSPQEEESLAGDTKAPNITFSELPKTAYEGDEVEITMYSDEPAVLFFDGKSSKKLVTEMKVTVSYNKNYNYSATDESDNTKDGKLKISFFKDESDDEEIVSDDNRDTYWDEVNKNNGYTDSSSSSSSDETELPQTGGISLVSSMLGGIAVLGAGVLLALKETSKSKKVANESSNETESVTADSSKNSDISTDDNVNEDVDSDKTEDSDEEVTEDVNKEEDNQIQE